jgi:hypothetical protein
MKNLPGPCCVLHVLAYRYINAGCHSVCGAHLALRQPPPKNHHALHFMADWQTISLAAYSRQIILVQIELGFYHHHALTFR